MTNMRKSIKRYICLLCCLLAALRPVPGYAREPEPGELYAQAAVLMDADSGRVLFDKNGSQVLAMASTTKIMTCIVALEQAQLQETVEISSYAASMPKVKLYVQKGERYLLEDLLYSLMLESHNDSAVIIAEAIGGSVEGFAGMMNEKAKEIGCEDTHFVTPNGLDNQDEGGEHATTAADLARIMKYCITESPETEEFLKITQTPSYEFTSVDKKRQFSCVNHNAFLTMMDGALSGKTGFTAKAGYCYVGALKRDERTFIVALLACGWPNNKTYKWKDARKLFQYGIDHYYQKDITNYDYQPNPIPVENGAGKDRLLKTKIQLPLTVKQYKQNMLLSDADVVQVRAELPRQLQAPVKKDTRIGSLNYYINGELATQMPVLAAQNIEKRSLKWYFMLVLSRYFYPYF